jgi:hypothetical protein
MRPFLYNGWVNRFSLLGNGFLTMKQLDYNKLPLTGMEIRFAGFQPVGLVTDLPVIFRSKLLIRLATSVLGMFLTGGSKCSFLRGDTGDPGHSTLIPHQFQRAGRHERVAPLLCYRFEWYQRVDVPFLGTATRRGY